MHKLLFKDNTLLHDHIKYIKFKYISGLVPKFPNEYYFVYRTDLKFHIHICWKKQLNPTFYLFYIDRISINRNRFDKKSRLKET